MRPRLPRDPLKAIAAVLSFNPGRSVMYMPGLAQPWILTSEFLGWKIVDLDPILASITYSDAHVRAARDTSATGPTSA